MRSFLLRLRGLDLACEEHGAGDSARALVLLHGFTGTRRDFSQVAPALARRGHRVLVLEQRGHGTSTWLHDERAYTLDALADDLAGALDALGIPRADLVAHSMGGQVALRVALAAPERVRSLVLASSWAGALDVWPRPTLRERVIEAVPFLRQAAVDWRRARRRPYAAPPSDVDPAAWRALPRRMRADDLRARIASLRTPTRVIVGGADARFLPHAQALARVMPEAQLSIVEHAGHQVMTERPRAFADAVEAHLASCAG